MAKESQGVIRAAGAMGLATFLSRLLGLVREQVFAVLFGAGNLTDAFQVAFRIPNLFRDLFAEGAMSAALVPTFTQTRIQEGDRRAWRVAGLVFRTLFVVVTIFSFIGILISPELVSLYASAYKHIPGKFELTVEMTRILFFFFPWVALAAAFMGILNSCGVFFLPAFASALFNLSSIVVGVVLTEALIYWGNPWGIQPIEGMAIGVVFGGMVQALCQIPALYRKGYKWQPRLSLEPRWYQDKRLKQMLVLMIPGTLGLAATQINILINTVLATSQGPGAVSWLNYSFRLMQFPIGLFGVSLASATLPRVSSQWVKGNIQEVSDTLTHSLKSVFAINLPATMGLIFLGHSIIELLFQYGRFYAEDTRATALALAMYSIGLTAYSGVKVLVPACYAFGNTRLPVTSSLIAVGVTIVLNLIMVGPFGYWGLALGTSVAAIFNFSFLLVSLRKLLQEKGGGLIYTQLVRTFLGYFAVSLVMGLICFCLDHFLGQWVSDSTFLFLVGKYSVLLCRILKMLLLVGVGVGVFMISARWFRLSEALEVMDLFKEKFKNKLRPNSR